MRGTTEPVGGGSSSRVRSTLTVFLRLRSPVRAGVEEVTETSESETSVTTKTS